MFRIKNTLKSIWNRNTKYIILNVFVKQIHKNFNVFQIVFQYFVFTVLTVDQDNRCEHVDDRIHMLPIGYHVDHTQHNMCLLKPKLQRNITALHHYHNTSLTSYIVNIRMKMCIWAHNNFCSFYLSRFQEMPSVGIFQMPSF